MKGEKELGEREKPHGPHECGLGEGVTNGLSARDTYTYELLEANWL